MLATGIFELKKVIYVVLSVIIVDGLLQMKREDMSQPGMLGNCLTIQQLHTGNVENVQQEIYPSKYNEP